MKSLKTLSLVAMLFAFGTSFGQFNVTFQVDMSQVTQSYTTPEVNGLFNGWCGNCAAMTDANGDNIWDITISLPAGPTEFKFSADNWNIQENLLAGSPCTITNSGFTNRTLNVTGDTTLAPVCWESCSACSGSPTSGTVTFQVDMSQYTGSYTEVNLNGDFNGWCGNCAVMTDPDGDMIYELDVTLPLGAIEYKFTVDGWTDDEQFTGGEPCTITNGGFTNRSHNVTMTETLPAYCWESCTPCGGTPSTADVTFQVDMSQYTGSYTEVNLNGTFNGWCGNCAVMTDPDGDMIYELTVNVPMDTIEFKYTVDGWTDDEQFNPGDPCTITDGTFTNRMHIVTMDETLMPYCWESCTTCTTIGLEDSFVQELSISPNPGLNWIDIQLPIEAGSGNAMIEMVDLRGVVVNRSEISVLNGTYGMDISEVSAGVYVITVMKDDVRYTSRFIKQ